MVQLQIFSAAVNLSIKANRFFFSVPKTKFILNVVKVLIKSNYFLGFTNCPSNKTKIIVFFKLNFEQKKPIMTYFNLVSTSSRSLAVNYKAYRQVPTSDLLLVSTNCGVLSHSEAFSKKLGGIILCKVM